ncbi:MAG: hypothetical protein MET45_10915 [Nostoc sp. LLA-1]|nr:hypothetical protein [Cyanocohniella sp. LLY]
MMMNDEINAKYESGLNRLIQELDRIKLPRLVENIKSNPKYMVIHSDNQSDRNWDDVKKSQLLEWLEEERTVNDNAEPETDASLLNRKLEKLRQLEQKGF